MKPSNFKIMKKSFSLEQKSNSAKILQVHHTIYLPDNEVKRLIFVSVVFDSECKKFACSDHHGNIFVFDLQNLKYWRLPEMASTILAFSPCKRKYLILGKSNCPFEILIVDTDNALQKFSAHGHRFQAKMASFSMKGDLLLTGNKFEALVWETHHYTLCYELKIDNLKMKSIIFIPATDYIFAHFVNNSVQMWQKNTLELIDERILGNLKDIQNFSFSKDGRCVAFVTGKPQAISLCNAANWQCLHKISLCKTNIKEITQILFLNNESEKLSRILAVFTKEGFVFLIDLEKIFYIQLFFDMKCKQLKSLHLSPNEKYLACIRNTGEIDVNDVSKLLRQLKEKKVTKNSLTLLETGKKERGAGEEYTTESKTSITDSSNVFISRQRLLSILKEFNEYPEKHRFKIWKQLLRLPMNQEAYCKLLAQPADTKYMSLETFLRIDNRKLLMNMKRTLCLITSLCPVLENVEYLPIQLFPFIKLLHKDPLFCFETIVTVLINYCQMWYNYDSHPPTDVLLMIDTILEQHDIKLHKHYKKIGVTSYLYAFSLMKTLFSENLHSKEWLQLWDHVLSNEPCFILMAIVAYSIVNRQTLLNYNNIKQFETFFDKRSRLLDMKSFIQECYGLLRTTNQDIHPRYWLKQFKSLRKTSSYFEINLVDAHIEVK